MFRFLCFVAVFLGTFQVWAVPLHCPDLEGDQSLSTKLQSDFQAMLDLSKEVKCLALDLPNHWWEKPELRAKDHGVQGILVSEIMSRPKDTLLLITLVQPNGHDLGFLTFTLNKDPVLDQTHVQEILSKLDPWIAQHYAPVPRKRVTKQSKVKPVLSKKLSSPPASTSFWNSPLRIELGVSMVQRKMQAQAQEDREPFKYQGHYPLYHFRMEFHPLFKSTPLWKGLGMDLALGYGYLQSPLPYAHHYGVPYDDSSCIYTDGEMLYCPTHHLDLSAGLHWRWLLSKKIVLGLLTSYRNLRFDLAPNKKYEGNGYEGLQLGLESNFPLGVDGLYAHLQGALIPLWAFGDGDMIADWGLTASGYGLSSAFELIYALPAQLSISLGYHWDHFVTQYDGTICASEACLSLKTDVESSDDYHQFYLTVGYDWNGLF